MHRMIHLFAFVGVTRLELATSRPPDAYSNQLSYTPIRSNQAAVLPGSPRGVPTPCGAEAIGLISKSVAKVGTFFE